MEKRLDKYQNKNIEINIVDKASIYPVAHALASPIRLEIIDAISHTNMNVNELAQALDVPLSTVALNVRVLEDAGLITTQHQPGVRGSMKLCSRRYDSVCFELVTPETQHTHTMSMQLPVGCFSACAVEPTCGLAGTHGSIGMDDDTRTFYHPDRFTAQLIWFSGGYVEYHFSSMVMHNNPPELLEVTFEACSEAPNYYNTWKSDITLWINGVEIGTWTCPGDFGGRRGRLNPPWWSDMCTQYGHLKTWQVSPGGSLLDGARISGVCLSDLRLFESDHIAVRIGVKKDAIHQGGVNLFGESFGDYPQAIVVNVIQPVSTEAADDV